MTATDTTYAALCAAIDDGDDAALLILADWLEEHGCPRADGLREIIQLGYSPNWDAGFKKWRWLLAGLCAPGPWAIPEAIFNRLHQGAKYDSSHAEETRSAAYLALAAALMESSHA